MVFSHLLFMQLFSADARVFSKENLTYFLAIKTWKNCPQKLLIMGPKVFFQYRQQAPMQPKSHFLFHKNVSLHDFYTMTLPKCMIIHILSRLAVKIYHKNLQKTRDLTYCINSGYLDLVVYLLHYKLDILKSKAVSWEKQRHSFGRFCTLISLINVELGINVEGVQTAKVAKSLNVELGINVEGGIFWKKLVHKSNKRGVEGGKI